MSLGKDISNFLSLVIQLKNMDISDNSTLNELESSMERYYLKKLKKELGEEDIGVLHTPVICDPIVSDPVVEDSSSDDELDMVVVQQVAEDIAQQAPKDIVRNVVEEVEVDVTHVVEEVSQDVRKVVEEVSEEIVQEQYK